MKPQFKISTTIDKGFETLCMYNTIKTSYACLVSRIKWPKCNLDSL